jgi:hypothetical protein
MPAATVDISTTLLADLVDPSMWVHCTEVRLELPEPACRETNLLS